MVGRYLPPVFYGFLFLWISFFSASFAAPAKEKLLFQIDSSIQGRPILYPGERATLIYKISFNRNIDLIFSALPFGNPKYIKKIGDVHIQEEQVGEVSVQRLIQNIEAIHPGHFLFGPASLTGYSYTMDLFGHKQYQKTPLQTQTSALEMQVLPFPQEGKPPSFHGTLGKIQVQILSPPPPATIRLGEEIKLHLRFEGITNASSLKFDFLDCQVGLVGFFKANTRWISSPSEETREMELFLEPLSPSIEEIPALVFSSFDPVQATYHSTETPSFPLKVAPLMEPNPVSSSPSLHADVLLEQLKRLPPPPILPPLFPSLEAVDFSFLKTPFVLWIVPVWLLSHFWNWLKRFRKEPPPPQGVAETVAVFDFDGTLTDRDSLLPFLYFCFGRWKTWWKLICLAPQGWHFYKKQLSRTEMKEEIFTAFFQGIPYDWVAAQGTLFAKSQLDRFVKPEAMERLQWHLHRNDRCLLVSASIEAYLLPWAKAKGLEKVLCSRLACTSDGLVTGKLKGKNCWGEEKKQRLVDYLQGRLPTALYVYGDSLGDQAILEMATHPFYRIFPFLPEKQKRS